MATAAQCTDIASSVAATITLAMLMIAMHDTTHNTQLMELVGDALNLSILTGIIFALLAYPTSIESMRPLWLAHATIFHTVQLMLTAEAIATRTFVYAEGFVTIHQLASQCFLVLGFKNGWAFKPILIEIA